MVLSFDNIKRSIACALLMVVLANAQVSPTTTVPNVGPVMCIESRLETIEDQLESIQKIVSTLNNPLIKKDCTVDLASYGFDDSTKYGYIRTSGGSSVEVLVPEDIDKYRGVTLVELDATTCTTRNRQHFDTYLPASAIDRVQFLETLQSATMGTTFVGVTADSAEYDGVFQNVVGSYLNRYNMNITGLQQRGKFAFIMQKGFPKKTVFEKKPQYGDSLLMKIVLSGSSINDVTFNRV